LRIALDFDETYTLNEDFWDDFIQKCLDEGHDVRIVTFRKSTMRDPRLDELATRIPVIYTQYKQKRAYCAAIEEWFPHVWIDDSPEFIVSY
jgi:hypothetical protein